MTKVGILGMGVMGWFHATQYARLEGVELAAIADLNPARLEAKEEVVGNIAREGGRIDLDAVARYTDASALIAEAGVDIVTCACPPTCTPPTRSRRWRLGATCCAKSRWPCPWRTRIA